MKRRILPNLAIILIIVFSGCAKQSALFKVNIEPESVYSNNMTQVIRTKVSYDGPADFLNELSNQGMSNPNHSTDSMVVTGEFKTGKMDTLGFFPVTTEIIEFKGGVANTMDMRMMAFGKGRKDGFPEFDSIYSPGIPKELHHSILDILKNTFSQIDFPATPLKVGETFEQETPIVIPFGESSIEMIIRTIYKLRQIKGGLAIFDTEQHIRLSAKFQDAPIVTTGQGNGFLYYDLKFSYVIELESIIDMRMEFHLEELNVIIDQNTLARQKSTMIRNE